MVYERYGGPERLELREVARPVPSTGQVLVEVVATAINLSDWEGLRGNPQAFDMHVYRSEKGCRNGTAARIIASRRTGH